MKILDEFPVLNILFFSVTLNDTIITPDLSNSSLTPDASCGPFTIQPSPTSASPLTSLGLPICDTITLTQNLTITVLSSEITTVISPITSTETKTEISSVTTTEVSTETTIQISVDTTTEISTETTTEMSTTTQILAQTISEIFTATKTELSTTTITAPDTATQGHYQNITFEKAEQVAAEIAKNLTIDTKSTSSHIRRLTSADDKRQSSKFVGYIAVIFVFAPLTLMLLADVKKVLLDFHSHENIYDKCKRSTNKCP
ncbi:mucin-2-like [Ruditapes philippinarum]|uniref:mucin-2-like n=1 Tax=Ruditapes philippinarum TaxID=129788 RepID=UPI00295B92FD|nr:mucin-2-like [Ruditapes philippinarum]